MKNWIPIIALLWIAASGCSLLRSRPSSEPNATAEALFEEGVNAFNNKRYLLAIDRFQRVKTEFPFSPQVTEAELKIAEAHYLNKQYPEAIAAFKEFQALHPKNENIPFVLYRLGLAHLDQFTSIDRDQKNTEIAKSYFETVVKEHPSSPYAAQAQEKLQKSLEYLAEREFYVASFYLREKKYRAAIDRLEGILKHYRNTRTAEKALYYLADSYRQEKNTVRAGLAYQAILHHYPESAFAQEARYQLSQLKNEQLDPLALLLMDERRPAPLPVQTAAANQQKELNLIAKKEVVHEEPGSEKGLLGRVASTLNPFNWFSSSTDGRKDSGKAEEAEKSKARPSGSAVASKAGIKKDSQIVAKIDESLKQRGISSAAPDAPAADLPKAEERPRTDTRELLSQIDSNLKKEGKLSDLPPPPEPAPVFSSAAPSEKGGGTRPPTVASSGLVASIDEALKRKGVDPAKVGEKTAAPQGPESPQRSGLPALELRKRIELGAKLPEEKGPLFLDAGSYQGGEAPAEGAEARKPERSEAGGSAVQGSERQKLSEALVKGPPQATAKAAEKKPAEEKKPEEEEKSAFEHLREQLRSLGSILNPFSW